MFDLGIFFKGVHRHIFAYATLFITPMRHFRCKWQVVVDPDCAKLKDPARVHSFEDIFRPDRGGKAIHDTIGLLQHFFFGFEARDDDHGAKDFRLHDLCVIAILCNDSWLDEEAFFKGGHWGTFTAGDNDCASTERPLDKPFDSGSTGSGTQVDQVSYVPV